MNIEPFEFLPTDLPNDSEKEAAILEAIRNRVVDMLEKQPDLLFSYMYRLDVEEWRIKKALKESAETPDLTLSKLIWERQKQRLATRQAYKEGRHL